MIAEAVAAAACAWNRPAADPYRRHGTAHVAAAVARYGFPESVQHELVDKVRRRDADAVVQIGRDDIAAPFGQAAGLRDMHFGRDRLCRGPVTREAWAPDRREPALVYCASGFCIAIPTICENVSRIDYTPWQTAGERVRREGDLQVHTVPEPSSILLAALGVLLVLGISRRRGS